MYANFTNLYYVGGADVFIGSSHACLLGKQVMKQLQQNGFTLIELMIAVAIVGILAAIAYPSYQDSVRKSRRADVEGVLLGLANAMERRFTETNSYVGAVAPPATYYTVTIPVATASSYTLNAAPIVTGPQANDKCGTLTLDQTGAKGITGGATGVTATDCWK
jgi:type IV pilus assembly protein PilE